MSYGIKVKSTNDSLERFEYNGLSSMQEAVDGYIEYVGSVKIKGIDCCLFCNEEFLFIDTEECKRYNPVTSLLAPLGVHLYGDCIIVANNEDRSDSRGFTEEEYNTISKEMQNFTANFEKQIYLLHRKYDRNAT